MSKSTPGWCFFDAVGTLIFPEPSAAEVYHQFGAKYGDHRSLLEHRRLFRLQLNELFGPAAKLQTSAAEERRRWKVVVGNIFGHLAHWEGLFEELWEYFERPASWRVYDDVPEVARRLAADGFQLGIASNFDGRFHAIHAGMESLQAFRWIFVSADVGWRKPASQFYDTIRYRCGCDPSQLWMIGDDWEFDALPAKSCGWNAVHLDRANKLPAVAERIDIPRIHSLRELSDVLRV
jgi:putative hydrolase of the HAD superfamily